MSSMLATIHDSFATACDAQAAPDVRLDAAERLIGEGLFEEMQPIVESLRAVPELKARVARALAACRQFQRWGLHRQLETYRGAAGASVETKSVMIARRPQSARCIVVFIGAANQFWISAYMLSRILPQDCNVIFLKDPFRFSYLMGLDAFGYGHGAMTAGLSRLIAQLGATQVYVVGTSSGGFAALHFGLTTGARAVLACSPATTLVDFAAYYRPVASEAPENAALYDSRLPDILDVKPLLSGLASPPPVTLVFGGAHATDAAMSRRLAGMLGVRLHAIEGFDRHDVLPHLLVSGEMKTLLSELLQS